MEISVTRKLELLGPFASLMLTENINFEKTELESLLRMVGGRYYIENRTK